MIFVSRGIRSGMIGYKKLGPSVGKQSLSLPNHDNLAIDPKFMFSNIVWIDFLCNNKVFSLRDALKKKMQL